MGWMPGELCNFDLTHDLDIDFFSEKSTGNFISSNIFFVQNFHLVLPGQTLC